MKEYFVIKGKHPGPTSVIMAGVHGNEPCGIKAIDNILPILADKIIHGKVVFVLGNPLAVAEGKRFIDMNLNRMFKEIPSSPKEASAYEYHRAKFLMSILNEADALLDIHSTRNKSEPYVFSEINIQNLLILENLPKEITKIVVGIDGFHPGCSESYMHRNGKIGISIECGQHEDTSAIIVAKNTIFSFLSSLEHFLVKKTKSRNAKREYMRITHIYQTQTSNFTINGLFPDFTEIRKGKILAYDGVMPVKAPQNGYILFAVNQTEAQREGFVIAEKIHMI